MLNIGLAVNHLLRNKEALTTLVQDRVYPLGVPYADDSGENLTFPFIIYGRSNIDPEYSKSNLSKDEVSVTIDIWSKSYKEVIEISMLVREALEGVRGNIAGVRVQDSGMVSASEAFDLPNNYGQILTFNFR